MELLNKLQSTVESRYEDMKQYTTLYNSQQEVTKNKLAGEYRDAYKKDPSSVDLKAIAKNELYIKGFHQTDIRRLQVSFLEAYNLYRSFEEAKDLEVDIVDTAEFLKEQLPKQMFTVEVVDGSNKFQEIVVGAHAELLEKYEASNYFKLFEEHLIKILDE